MCGADSWPWNAARSIMGSSPRVRSRQHHTDRAESFRGIISACAEQTDSFRLLSARPRDHLRVCGADSIAVFTDSIRVGSSPRVRSRLRVRLRGSPATRIISACAEQTMDRQLATIMSRDHLRVCGEDWRWIG